jgi:hypothetical protein
VDVTGIGFLPVLVGLGAVLIAIVLAAVGWDRYRPHRDNPSPRAQPTNEVFVDPETGRRMRVWIEPGTGVREYREE